MSQLMVSSHLWEWYFNSMSNVKLIYYDYADKYVFFWYIKGYMPFVFILEVFDL